MRVLYITALWLLSLSLSQAFAAPKNNCHQLLFQSRTGPGELEFQFDQSSQEVRSFFDFRLSNGVVTPPLWREQFVNQSPAAGEALRFFSRLGKKFIHAHELPERYRVLFQEILKINEQELASLSNLQLLELLNTFAHWNHIPPQKWSFALQKEMAQKLDLWTDREFAAFAALRKLSPMTLEHQFQKRFEKALLQSFTKLPRRTQIDVLTGELLNGAPHTIQVWQTLLASTNVSLSDSNPNANPPRVGALKDLYRGILRFRSGQHGALSPLVSALEINIESFLSQSGLSLMGGGTSGYTNNKKTKIDEKLLRFEWVLFQVLGSESVRQEWMNASIPGMFDPVDYYFPEHDLVVEWDGLHHYLRLMDDQAQSKFEPSQFVLRPMDRAKDIALEASGMKILRVAPFTPQPTPSDLRKYLP